MTEQLRDKALAASLWTARVVVSLLLTGVFSLGVLFAGAELYQIRAEHLLARVTSLRVGVSAFADAQRLMEDYKRNIEIESKACTPDDCRFAIRLWNRPFPSFYDHPLLWKVGVRPAGFVAQVSVRSGTISYAYFGVHYRTQFGYWLEASVHAARELTMFDKCSQDDLGRNSEFVIREANLTNGDGGGHGVRVAFGKKVSDEQRSRGTDIRLGCITAIPGCRSVTDLMPRAWGGQTQENDSDETFDVECERFLLEQRKKQGEFPWQLETAFSPVPVTVNAWILTRPTHKGESK